MRSWIHFNDSMPNEKSLLNLLLLRGHHSHYQNEKIIYQVRFLKKLKPKINVTFSLIFIKIKGVIGWFFISDCQFLIRGC